MNSTEKDFLLYLLYGYVDELEYEKAKCERVLRRTDAETSDSALAASFRASVLEDNIRKLEDAGTIILEGMNDF